MQDYVIKELVVKVKAVELLEVMLENTSELHSAAIRKQLKETVDKESLAASVCYFQKMTMEPGVKDAKKDDDAERGMFQCYHALVALADDDKEPKITSADIDGDISLSLRKKSRKKPKITSADVDGDISQSLKEKSRSVEIRIKHGNDKPHLATVHFFHDPKVQKLNFLRMT